MLINLFGLHLNFFTIVKEDSRWTCWWVSNMHLAKHGASKILNNAIPFNVCILSVKTRSVAMFSVAPASQVPVKLGTRLMIKLKSVAKKERGTFEKIISTNINDRGIWTTSSAACDLNVFKLGIACVQKVLSELCYLDSHIPPKTVICTQRSALLVVVWTWQLSLP